MEKRFSRFLNCTNSTKSRNAPHMPKHRRKKHADQNQRCFQIKRFPANRKPI